MIQIQSEDGQSILMDARWVSSSLVNILQVFHYFWPVMLSTFLKASAQPTLWVPCFEVLDFLLIAWFVTVCLSRSLKTEPEDLRVAVRQSGRTIDLEEGAQAIQVVRCK
jgi:hypothetical protein